MNSLQTNLLSLTACLTIALPGAVVPDRLLVQVRVGADHARVRQELVGQGAASVAEIPSIRVHVLRVPEQAIERVSANLMRSGLFTFVERDGVAHAFTTPNDPSYTSQWHLSRISAAGAWDVSTGSPTTIAIVDSGVDPTHPDLAGKLVPGWSFVAGNSDTSDVYGHGTKVAGAIAAATNNATGVAGVVWQNMIMPLVALDSTGYASYSSMAQAITYAADRGVRIINISLGGTVTSSTLQSAVDAAWNKGSLVVVAAGNYGNTAPTYPAACNRVIAVGATNSSDTKASFSTYGSWIDLTAPGEGILTTVRGGGYGSVSGTSFASPITAGVAALILSVRPSMSVSELSSLLVANTDDLGTPGFDDLYGAGRVNAYKAAQAAATQSFDRTAPTVSITSPSASASVAGTVSVLGTASDNVLVSKTELYIDGSLSKSATGATFSHSWDTSTVANGNHQVTVRAYDSSQNTADSTVTVVVSNPIPVDTQSPVVSLTNPTAGTYARNKNIAVRTSASDNVGVVQSVIRLDGVQVASCAGSSCSYTWNVRKSTVGAHTLEALAWDAAGNVAPAPVVSVTLR